MDSISKAFPSLWKGDSEEAKAEFVQHAVDFASGLNASDQSKGFSEVRKLYTDCFSRVKESLERTFGRVTPFLANQSLVSMFYYMELIDEFKNPSWKRRKHFFLLIDEREIDALHEALYLAD